jgi:nucleoside phosphorylase
VFEEYIAQGNDMIRRLDLHVGLTDERRVALPPLQQVAAKEASDWRQAVEERIRRNFGSDVLARYNVSWQLYSDEVDRHIGDEVTRALNTWRRIVIFLEELESRSVPAREQQDQGVDIAILTAIEVERKAVCAAFGLGDDNRVEKGERYYWRGQLPRPDGSVYEVVVAQPISPGQVEATALTMDVLRYWNPDTALFVGIAASTDPENVKLGDVVVGNCVWYYEGGKVTPQGTKPQPQTVLPDAGLLKQFTGMRDWNGNVEVTRPDGTATTPSVHQGVIASGEKVIADTAVRDEIASKNRKIIAIAMEDYGFSRAAWQNPERVRHIVFRGICDYGSADKKDAWHQYAARSVAAFAKHFLLDRP